MSAAEMREALRPCPFCGGEATYCADHTTECVDSISCRRCDFYMSDPELEQGSVIAAWNRRAPFPDEEGMVERVKAAILERMGPVFGSPEYLADPVKLARAEKRQADAAEEFARAAIRALNGGEP